MIFRRLVQKKCGGRQTDIFFGVGGGARQRGVRLILQVGADTLEDTMNDFQKVIYENVEKQHCLPDKHIYIYGSQTSEVLWRFTCCIGFFCL